MSVTAQAADGSVHEFPDNTDKSVVDRVMKDYAQQNPLPYTEADIQAEGAPWQERWRAQAPKEEDKFQFLRGIDPRATRIEDNYIYRDPRSGKVVRFNDPGFWPSTGDIASIIPEGMEAAGATLGALGAGTLAIPSGPGAFAAGMAGAGAGAATARELENWLAGKLMGRPDTRTTGEVAGDVATTAALNAAGEAVAPLVGAAARGVGQQIKKVLPDISWGQAERGAVERTVRDTGMTPEEVAQKLASERESAAAAGLAPLPVNTGEVLGSPTLSAAYRSVVHADPEVLDQTTKALTEQGRRGFAAGAPEGVPGVAQDVAAQSSTRLQESLLEAQNAAARAETRAGSAGSSFQQALKEQQKAEADALAGRQKEAADALKRQFDEQRQFASQEAAARVAPEMTRGNAQGAAAKVAEDRYVAAVKEGGNKYKAASAITDEAGNPATLVTTAPLRAALDRIDDAVTQQYNVLDQTAKDIFAKMPKAEGFGDGTTAAYLDAQRKAIGSQIAALQQQQYKGPILHFLRQARNVMTEAIRSPEINPLAWKAFSDADTYWAKKVAAPFGNRAARQVFAPSATPGLKVDPSVFLQSLTKVGGANKGAVTEGIARFKEAVGDSPEALGYLRQYMLNDLYAKAVNKTTHELSPAKFNDWVYANQETIGLVPGLPELVGSTKTATSAIESMLKQGDEATRALTSGAQQERLALTSQQAQEKLGVSNLDQVTKLAQKGVEDAEQLAQRIVAESEGHSPAVRAEAQNWANAVRESADAQRVAREIQADKDVFDKNAFARFAKTEPDAAARKFLSSGNWRAELEGIKQATSGNDAAYKGFTRAVYDEVTNSLMDTLTKGADDAFMKVWSDAAPKMKGVLGPERFRHMDEYVKVLNESRKTLVGKRINLSESAHRWDPKSAVADALRRGAVHKTFSAFRAVFYPGASSAGWALFGPVGAVATPVLSSAYDFLLSRGRHRVNEMIKEILLDPKASREIFDRVLTRQNAPSTFKTIMSAFNKTTVAARRLGTAAIDTNQREN